MANFLTDLPAREDENRFEVHLKIAEAIVREITEGEDPEANRRIALVGGWGSGKSTILSYVENGLKHAAKDEVKPCYLSFDLWSHSGDSLRRSFLTKLADEIEEHIGADRLKVDKEWEGVKQKLAYEEQTVLTLQRQDLSPMVILIVLLVALFAFFGVARGIFSEFAPPDFVLRSYANTLQGIFTIVTASVVCAIAVKKGERRKILADLSQGLAQVIGHLSGKPDTKTATTTQREAMGSLAFERYISDILAIAHKHSPESVFVITLDNLDRLSEEELRAAWGSIQLFANYMDSSAKHSSRAWLILPVSEEAIRCLLSEDASRGSMSFSKLFMVKYEIPRPIRSEWKCSILDLLSKAFPQSDEAQRQIVFSIINAYPPSCNARIARESKRIINDHVALSQIYTNVPLDSIAVFLHCKATYVALVEEDKPDAFEDYMQQIFSGERVIDLALPTESRGKDNSMLAMLTYGVFDEESAQEALLFSGLSDLGFIRHMDLASLANASSAIWDTMRACVEKGVIHCTDEGGRERFCALMGALYDYECSNEEELAAYRDLGGKLSRLIGDSKWPSFACGGKSALLSLKMAGDRHKALGQIAHAAEMAGKELAGSSDERIAGWVEEAVSFLSALGDEALAGEVRSIDLDLGKNLYPFLLHLLEYEGSAKYIETIRLSSPDAFRQIVNDLVVHRPSNNVVGMAALLGSSDLFTTQLDNFDYGNASSLGLNNQEARDAYFFEAWGVHRASQSKCAEIYLSSCVKNHLLSRGFYAKAQTQNEWAAVIGYFIHEAIRPSDAESNTLVRQHAEAIGWGPVHEYLFGGPVSEPYLEDIFDNLEGRHSALKQHVAKLVVDNIANGSKIPYRHIHSYLRNASLEEVLSRIPRIVEIYSCEDLMTATFDQRLSELYLASLKEGVDPDFTQWIQTSLSEIDESSWSVALTDNPALINLLLLSFDGKRYPSSFEASLTGGITKENLFERCRNIEAYTGLLVSISTEGFEPISALVVESFRVDEWRAMLTVMGDPLKKRLWFKALSGNDICLVCCKVIESRAHLHLSWLIDLLDSDFIMPTKISDVICEKIQGVRSHPWKNDNDELERDLDKVFTLVNRRRADADISVEDCPA